MEKKMDLQQQQLLNRTECVDKVSGRFTFPLCLRHSFLPPQMSLTLEEKQQLAKEQEQAAKLRSQQPLAPQTIKPAASSNTQVNRLRSFVLFCFLLHTAARNILRKRTSFSVCPATMNNPLRVVLQTKDLTSSLLNNMTSLNSLSLANAPRPAPVQGATIAAFPSPSPMMGSMGAPVSNGFNPPMGFQAGGMGMGMRPAGPNTFGGMATTTSTPNFGALTQSQGPLGQTAKGPDMSALDNLFTPNKPKVTLNQIGPKAGPGTNPPWLNQYGSAQNTQLQGAAAVGAVPGAFGMQANPFFSPQNFSQAAAPPGMNQSGLKHSTSANNDLKDLFG